MDHIARIDLNADLGEGGPADTELLEVVTSASVACGFHAGDSATMLATARRAAATGVALGAHPSYPDRDGFGRHDMDLPPDELLAAVAYQLGAMASIAATAGTAVRFVKPHGALYNRAATDPAVAEVVVDGVARAGMRLPLLAPPGSVLSSKAGEAGITVYCEAFVDRAYAPDGQLIPRSQPGAVLHDPDEVAGRALELALHRRVSAVDGSVIELAADSICVHGDTPGAAAMAVAIRRGLEAAGVAVVPFSSP